MDHFSRDDLRALLTNRQTPCVSLFLHTTRGPAHQDQKGWKNLLREAEERLLAAGQRPPEAKNLLAPAQELLNDPPFWLNVSNGLAAFLSPEMTRFYRLPATFRDQALCNDHFRHNEQAPLVLAADTVLQPIYREVNTYPHLLAEGIKGSPERLSAQELHGRAWDLVRPHFDEEREKIAARYRDLVGSRRGHT